MSGDQVATAADRCLLSRRMICVYRRIPNSLRVRGAKKARFCCAQMRFSSSSARISSKRRMAADWEVKSGIKTRRSTSGRVRYRRRMKPSSVAGIAPKHSRISSGLRPRRRALEIRDRDTSIPHRAVITLPNSSSVPGVTSKAPTATMRRKAAVNGPSELPDFTPAARRALTLYKPTKKKSNQDLFTRRPCKGRAILVVREFERRGSKALLDNETVLQGRRSVLPFASFVG